MEVVPHGLAGARSVDQSFKQRIAGQTIRAMNAGSSSLATGIQSGQTSLSREIGAHASHCIVRRRTDRDYLGGDVDVVLQTSGIDARETLPHVVRFEVCEVEVND